jgi:large subunit ribosomal protein L29
MKPRSVKDLIDLSKDELVRTLEDAKETLANLRFQLALGELEDKAYIKILRRDIARIHTVIKQKS